MTPPPDALALVHEGWDHLKHQRPLAAWASWQRALRVEPDQPAAREALDRLAAAPEWPAPELPASARKEYRFRTPSDPERRARWDAAFRGRDLSDLSEAASAFAALAAEDAADPDAPYNQALCLAWLGRNAEAIGWLDESVIRGASSDFDAAASAWTLAGVLRQGGGAEELADDFFYTIEVAGNIQRIRDALDHDGRLRRLPTPETPRSDFTIDQWLDRPWPEPREALLRLDEVPRLTAIVTSTSRSVYFSTSSPQGVGDVVSTLSGLGLAVPPIRQTPRSLAHLHGGLPTILLPDWLGDDSRRRLRRENVEDYFENRWIHLALRGLEGASPLDASRGNIAQRARLAGTIALSEELAARPGEAERYEGYPFDRLRRRLGLTPADPEAIDPADVTNMSVDDLDRLDPGALDDHTLSDAFRSASALGDDARTARFADRLVATGSPALARLDLRDVFAPLVRKALADDRPDEALWRIDEAITADAATRGRGRRPPSPSLTSGGPSQHARGSARPTTPRRPIGRWSTTPPPRPRSPSTAPRPCSTTATRNRHAGSPSWPATSPTNTATRRPPARPRPSSTASNRRAPHRVRSCGRLRFRDPPSKTSAQGGPYEDHEAMMASDLSFLSATTEMDGAPTASSRHVVQDAESGEVLMLA